VLADSLTFFSEAPESSTCCGADAANAEVPDAETVTAGATTRCC
jgi:hypothetical protein